MVRMIVQVLYSYYASKNKVFYLTYIADLHCDLLSYLSESDSHSPYDASSRCSLAQMRKGKKISGGKYKKQRKKKLFEKESQQRVVKLGETKRKKVRVQAGKTKTFLLSSNEVNLIDKKTKKSKKAKITNVLETPNNRFLARQNVLVKGAVIETDAGKAKITSRPSQEGSIQAVLVEDKE